MAWFERQFTFGLAPSMLPFFLERLEGTACRLEQKVADLSEEHLAFRLDSKWSVKENIGHLLDVDVISGRRIDEIITGRETLSRADVQASAHYNDMSIHEIIEEFSSNRQGNVERLRSLTDAQLVMTSVHPRLKVAMSPVDLAWFDAEHDDHHLARITSILSSIRSLEGINNSQR